MWRTVAAQAYLTMRLEASAVSGQAMVSDNQDLGFIVADQRRYADHA